MLKVDFYVAENMEYGFGKYILSLNKAIKLYNSLKTAGKGIGIIVDDVDYPILFCGTIDKTIIQKSFAGMDINNDKNVQQAFIEICEAFPDRII